MGVANNNYSVLIQVHSQNEAERIITVFRSAGLATRAHRVTSEQDFDEHIADGSWDLLIVDNHHPEVSLQYSLSALKKSQLDMPLILITDDPTTDIMEKAFKLGIADVVNKNNDAHFSHSAIREIGNARERKRRRELEADYNELQSRAEQLLAESDDAIAYVSDGILVQLNDRFAEIFAYSDPDELDCSSIIDLVADDDQDRFKNFFKHFTKGDIDQTELAFNAVKSDGEAFEAFMTLANATVDGEACTQVNITTSSAAGASAGGGSSTIDGATELHNRYYLADKISSTAIQVSSGSAQASLLSFKLDDYPRLLDDNLTSGIDTLIKDLASLIEKELSTGDEIGRLADDCVAVIVQKPTNEALDFSRELLKAIEGHICEVGDKTVQYTCTCAVMNNNIKEANDVLDNVVDAIGTIRLDRAKNSAEIFTPKVKEAPKPGADDISNIEEAIELGSFRLLFQPIMSLQGDERENYEASVWLRDGEQDVYPESMIASAANTKLDRWIILEATKALSMHRANGHNTRLIINLTMNALMDEGIAPWVGVAIKAANLSSEHIVFQFNEDDITNNLKSAIKTIPALQSAGFAVAIGCFGKNADPFKLLKHLKPEIVKIDGHFTKSIASGDTDELKKIFDKSKEASMQTILPEVDNAGALATLWQLGTHYIQGSYLQLPSPEMNYEFTEIA